MALQVTMAERSKAAAHLGGNVTAITVAFGSRLPEEAKPHITAAAAASTPGRSVLELELQQVSRFHETP